AELLRDLAVGVDIAAAAAEDDRERVRSAIGLRERGARGPQRDPRGATHEAPDLLLDSDPGISQVTGKATDQRATRTELRSFGVMVEGFRSSCPQVLEDVR